MKEGTDRTADVSSIDDESAPATEAAVEAVGTYETKEGVVFYDTENPLAWVQSAQTVDPEEMI